MPAPRLGTIALLLAAGCVAPDAFEAFDPTEQDRAVAAERCVVGGAGLLWPIDCVPGDACWRRIGTPDLDRDGLGEDCEPAGYSGHRGTDLSVSEAAMLEGVEVLAAAAGRVAYVRDDRHDRCDVDLDHPDCVAAPGWWSEPGQASGDKVCTPRSAEFCDPDEPWGDCYWCSRGGNVIVVRHDDAMGIFATSYSHLRQGSARVRVGDQVGAGSPLALVGSSGSSSGPHLHFEVWDTGWKHATDPWHGPCSETDEVGLFLADPPWCVAR